MGNGWRKRNFRKFPWKFGTVAAGWSGSGSEGLARTFGEACGERGKKGLWSSAPILQVFSSGMVRLLCGKQLPPSALPTDGGVQRDCDLRSWPSQAV